MAQARIAGVVAGFIAGGQARIAGIRATTAAGGQARIAGISATTVAAGSGGKARIAGIRASTGSPKARIAHIDAAALTATYNLPRLTASAGSNASVAPFATVPLDGTGSANLDGPITYQWTQTSGPAVTLSSASAVAPTFTAPAALIGSTLVFQLTVADGTGAVRTSTVNVTVAAHNLFRLDATGPTPLHIIQL